MKDTLLRLFCVVLISSWATGAVAQEVADVKDRDLVVEVLPGDSISVILIRHTGNAEKKAMEAVQQYNNIEDPKLLSIGQILRIPATLVPVEMHINLMQATTTGTCGTSQLCVKETIVSSGDEQLVDTSQSQVAKSILQPESTSAKLKSDSGTGTDTLLAEVMVEELPEVTVTEPQSVREIERDIVREIDETDQDIIATDEQLPASAGAPDTVDVEPTVEDREEVTFSTETITQVIVARDSDGVSESEQVEQQEIQPEAESKAEPKPEIQPEMTPEVASADSQPPPEPAVSRPPGLFEVDEDAAARALERSLVRIDALLLRPGEIEASLDFSLAYDRRVIDALIEIEDIDGNETTAVVENEVIRSSYSAIAGISVGLAYDTQIEIQAPFKKISVQDNILQFGSEVDGSDSSATGVGDVRLSVLKTVFREKGRRPDVIARISYDSDSGGSSNGIELGSNHKELTIGVNATKRQDPLVFVYGLSHTIANENRGLKPGGITRLNAGTLLAASPYTSLSFVFDYAVIREAALDGRNISGSGERASSFTFGVSSVISRAVFLSAGVNYGLSGDNPGYNFYLGFSKRY